MWEFSPTDLFCLLHRPFGEIWWRFPRAFVTLSPRLKEMDLVESNHIVFAEKPGIINVDQLWGDAPFTPLGKRIAENLLALPRCKKIVLHSEHSKQTLLRRVLVEESKIAVIPCLLEPMPLPRKKHEGFHLLFVGRDFERKGGLELLAASERLSREVGGLRLSLVTRQANVPLQALQAIQSNPAIQAYFDVDLARVHSLFAEADAYCMPSRWEGFGVAAVEALFYGLPLVVSDVKGLGEKITDGRNGFVCRPGDAESVYVGLKQLVESRALCTRMGRESRKRFDQQFNPDEIRRKLKAVYEEAAGSGSRERI
ncbi:MAG TPA: glycosyltransferase family 4 protein [Candidatus Diapherotrites archaeon]|uniref:Glycosyltransferase family 4 protein n=1 Tax=Candidatus Iainarchaeum sp. TaxID=3101447 RepID=A0A7J4JK61_9ARCH|nr:glycosyltransferase family 4 protein [Candidatus Diapherotrites archaeon]